LIGHLILHISLSNSGGSADNNISFDSGGSADSQISFASRIESSVQRPDGFRHGRVHLFLSSGVVFEAFQAGKDNEGSLLFISGPKSYDVAQAPSVLKNQMDNTIVIVCRGHS
jgi:hypothetical protein